MVDGLHPEVPCHKLDDGFETVHGGADGHASKPVFGDGGVDDALGTEFVEEALGDFVGALVFGDFFAHQVDCFIAAHFFGHGITERFADCVDGGFLEGGFVEGRGLQDGALRVEDVTVLLRIGGLEDWRIGG